jgi:diaminohydroxyphosphoribosylaminopyrimidine deaminase/5-amino-6-(5-phosphoribosylamino)uracil reductase
LKDNPSLTVRLCEGKNPLRLVIDNRLQLPGTLTLFDEKVPTVIFNSLVSKSKGNLEYVKINFDNEVENQILEYLFQQRVLSLIIEGGRKTLESFIQKNLWDEALRFVGNKQFEKGTRAPKITGMPVTTEAFDDDKLYIYRNRS